MLEAYVGEMNAVDRSLAFRIEDALAIEIVDIPVSLCLHAVIEIAQGFVQRHYATPVGGVNLCAWIHRAFH